MVSNAIIIIDVKNAVFIKIFIIISLYTIGIHIHLSVNNLTENVEK